MRETELIVVRHGETEWNVAGREQGQFDSELTARGKAQARAVAERLQGRRVAAIFTSDLWRALQTANIIAAATGSTVIGDARLRERHLGVFQGLTWPEIKTQYPNEYREFQTGNPDYVITGGESARQRFERTVGCVEEIARRHPGESLVIVAHGGVLNGLFRHVLHIPLEAPRRFKLWNASLNVFYFGETGDWMLGTWGDTAHLSNLGTLDDR